MVDDLARAGFAVFDRALDLLCDGSTCGHRIPGTTTAAIVDRDHWTGEGSLFLAPFLACFLEDLGLL